MLTSRFYHIPNPVLVLVMVIVPLLMLLPITGVRSIFRDLWYGRATVV